MLSLLSLRDFAVVRAAELRFGSGLTVISGETGAGKSLLVDALLWLSGARADAGMVRAGAPRAELTAEFDLCDALEAGAWLAEHELDDGGQCQLRRVVRADGGSKAWINGRAVTLAQLSALSGMLVEIHGQHEHQALLDRGRQLALLDAFGQRAPLLEPVRAAALAWQQAERELVALRQRGDVADRIDYLGHQIDELEREELSGPAIEELLARHRRSANSGALITSCDRAATALDDDEGAAALVRQAISALGKWATDEPRLAEAQQLLESARLQLQEAATLVADARDSLEVDPQAQAKDEARLSRLHDLARKHRAGLPELEARLADLNAELFSLRGAETRVEQLEQQRQAAALQWKVAAETLSAARQRDAEALGAAVSALMQDLGMAGGVFVPSLEPAADPKPQPHGLERVEFLVSANPGQPPRPLRKVASGGELARIALAIEVATLGLDNTPTMVFDEVDTGIGGSVAEIVGQKLRQLGVGRQVLCVTHLAQVAAQGHGHYRVTKTVQGDQTFSEASLLDAEGRIEEVARMLGGIDITAAVRTSARQMLDKARKT